VRPAFLFRGFKTTQQLLQDSLGSLERDILTIVWSRGDTTVRDACADLDARVAYTTVMTTMDRLFKKGLLSRTKVGRAFVYCAIVTKQQLDGALATDLVRSLLQRNEEELLPILSSLVDAVSEQDHTLLDDLERLIHEKRLAPGLKNG